MSNTTLMREAWGVPCKAKLIGFSFWNGRKVAIQPSMIDAYKALDAVFKKYNYEPNEHTGTQACRQITNGVGYSLHAYGGVAIDVSWDDNPYQWPYQYQAHGLITNMDPRMVAEVKAIRTNDGLPVWGWGGDYSGNKDPMHYELHVTPAQLAKGIRNVPAGPATIGDPPTEHPTRPVEADVASCVIENIDGRGEFCIIDPSDGHIEDWWYDANGDGPHHLPLGGKSPIKFADVDSYTHHDDDPAQHGVVIVSGIGGLVEQWIIMRGVDGKWSDWVNMKDWLHFTSSQK